MARADYHSKALTLASFVLVLGAWEYAGRVPVSNAFPPLSATAAAAWEMIRDGRLPNALAVTVIPLAVGVTISAIAGVLLGLATGLNNRVEWLGIPLFLVLQAAPLAAIIPMIVLAYGVGLAAKVVVVCILAIPVIVLNSYKAVRHTSN